MTESFYSTPKTFMEMLLECSEFIDHQRLDPHSTKADVLDSMEKRVSFLVGKMAAYPVCTSFRIMQPGPD